MRFATHQFTPLPAALWWPARKALIAADLHLEKASFLASHGQLLPPYDTIETLSQLARMMDELGAREVWCLGDSFHDPAAFQRLDSDSRAWVRRLTSQAEWTWITGNHDPAVNAALGGHSCADAEVDGVVLRHEAQPSDPRPELSGHYHPKLWLRVRGRMIARRCFAQGATKLILPALGAFTGGLDVTDPVFQRVLGGQVTAVIGQGGKVLRYPVGAFSA
jgi:uncharacterized protein